MSSIDSVIRAEDVLERYESRVYESGGARLPYRLLRPRNYDQDGNTKYPLVLFFHGAGECGDDNRKQLVHGAADFASDDVMAKYPCFVVVPQCPGGQQWVDTPWTADRHTMPEKMTQPMQLAFMLLDKLEREFPIDERRLYVTGLSMGGFGVWDAVQRVPVKFAAAVPVCGGGDTALAGRIKAVPIWAFHGDGDRVVKPQRSRDMIAALKAAGGMPRYTEYANTGHDCWTITYANRDLYAWMFAQRRPE
jgi:predicted peptidase